MTRCDEKDLRKAREAAGLTRLEAAERLGVSEGTLKRWETGEKGQKPSSTDVSRMEETYEALGLWYRWMWWNDDGFRDHFPSLVDLDKSLLASAVGVRQEMEDVQKAQGAYERDLLDGKIDDPQAQAQYLKEAEHLLTMLLTMRMKSMK